MRNRVGASVFVVVLGVALGLVGARYVFVNSGLSLVPWGLVSLGIGALSATHPDAMRRAAGFGFALAFSFMMFSYDGKDGIVSAIAPFLLLGLVGAACAVALALAGRGLRMTVSSRR